MITAQQLREKYAKAPSDTVLLKLLEKDLEEKAKDGLSRVYYPDGHKLNMLISLYSLYFKKMGYGVEVYELGVDLTW